MRPLAAISISPAALKEICAYAATLDGPYLALSFPIIPEGTYAFEDKRNGQLRLAGRTPVKRIVGRGATRVVERETETVSRVWSDPVASGAYYRVEAREPATYLALLKAAARGHTRNVNIRCLPDPWSYDNDPRPVTFELPRNRGESGGPLRGTIADVSIDSGTGNSDFTLTEMVFERIGWAADTESFTTYYAGESTPLTASK